MFERNTMVRWVQGVYVLGIPLWLLSVTVHKPYKLWGIEGYYSALMAPLSAYIFAMLSMQYPAWRREVRKTCLGLVAMVYSIRWLVTRWPMAAESLVDENTWEVVLGKVGLDHLVNIGVMLSPWVGDFGPRRWDRTRCSRIQSACLHGLTLGMHGVVSYGLLGLYAWAYGTEKTMYTWWGTAFWWVVSTAASTVVGMALGRYMEEKHPQGHAWQEEAIQADVWLYGRLLSFFIAALLLTNMITVRYIMVGQWLVTAGLLTYPCTFLLTDIITELHGRKAAEQTVIAGFVASVWMFLGTWLLVHLEGDDTVDACCKRFFSFAPGMLLGSMAAYLIAQWVDVQLFDALKKATHGRYLWLRNNVGTMVSQLIDTFVFGFVAWELWPRLGTAMVVDRTVWLEVGRHEYIGKVVMALLDTPLLYAALYLIHKVWYQGGNRHGGT